MEHENPTPAADGTIPQAWTRYAPADHALWDRLYARQVRLLPGRVAPEFMTGLETLQLSSGGIPDFADLSERLHRLTGWSVHAVPGLVSEDLFFEHLAHRRFVAARFLRTADQIDYLQEPDVFHDVFGHVPLLAHPVFADYMQAYGQGGLRAARHGAIDKLARLYWYTVEFGLIRGNGGLKLYGSGIVSSHAESLFALDDPSPNRLGFELSRVMRTRYRIDDFQQSYFVIDSFESLLSQTLNTDFGPLYDELAAAPDIDADTVLAQDRIFTRGSQAHARRATARGKPSVNGGPAPLLPTRTENAMTMNDTNPLGLDGFAFAEFTSPDPASMAMQFEQLGFVAAARVLERGLTLYRQGNIRFVLNAMDGGQGRDFRKLHGASANGMAFRVADAAAAHAAALERGAKAVDAAQGALGAGSYAIEGIGGSYLYLVDSDPFAAWSAVEGWRDAARVNDVGLRMLDHLTHNVRRGHMREWSSFYRTLFGFEEQKYFDIKGQATGLFSQAMIAPDAAIRIPLNESQDDKSQIEEFLREYNGEGIQHLALTTEDIYATVEKLRRRGVRLQDTIETYYELVDKRVPGHGENLERLRSNRILIDGDVDKEGILLQIFTENVFGPIFFEIIQRKGNQGFGNGNFQALFESIELDQIRRGVI